ncbi:MAG: cyclase family protein [Planctomycetota bacterium]|jgi:kynurenine formamidase
MPRIVDLTRTLRPGMTGVDLETFKTIAEDGWNAKTLHLYSHCGTHMDAPRHFIESGVGLDALALEKCVGPARLLDLSFVEAPERMSVEHLAAWAHGIGAGDRLLLKASRAPAGGDPEQETDLPGVGLPLAEWLAERGIALLGVERHSVGYGPDLAEVTAVHKTLLDAGVVLVEGLAHLDELQRDEFTFVALPLKIAGGDGSPARAIAIEE